MTTGYEHLTVGELIERLTTRCLTLTIECWTAPKIWRVHSYVHPVGATIRMGNDLHTVLCALMEATSP